MRLDRAVAWLIVVAFLGAAFAPCRAMLPAAAQGEELAQRGSISRSSARVAEETTPASGALLTARCPCGCDERPAIAGSPPGLGVALISRSPSLGLGTGDQELGSLISFLPTSPLSGIDIVPRPT